MTAMDDFFNNNKIKESVKKLDDKISDNKAGNTELKTLDNSPSEMKNIELLGKDVDKLKWYSATDFTKWIIAQTRQPSSTAVSHGDIKIEKYTSYYDVSHTITTALTTSQDQDQSGYNTENIYRSLQRYGEKVVVSNDGSDTLFVVVSHGGETNLSHENPIYPGENKTYFNVYQLLLRSATSGLPYRVTEYPICCNTGSSGASIRGSATEAVINISAAGDNTIIAAPATTGQRIRIVNLFFIASAAVAVTLKSGAATNLTGAMSFAGNGGMGFNGDFNPLQMAVNQAFIINLGGAVQVSGFVLYYVE